MESSASVNYDYSWTKPWIEKYAKDLYITQVDEATKHSELRVTTHATPGVGISCECNPLDLTKHPAFTSVTLTEDSNTGGHTALIRTHLGADYS